MKQALIYQTVFMFFASCVSALTHDKGYLAAALIVLVVFGNAGWLEHSKTLEERIKVLEQRKQ